MKKVIFVLSILLLLVGCSNQNKANKVIRDYNKDNCILVDRDKKPLSIREAWTIFDKKIQNQLGEGTKTQPGGLEVHNDRVYYTFITYLDSDLKRTVTGNYVVDIYNGKVYTTDYGDYRDI